jgi:hypothetical protein
MIHSRQSDTWCPIRGKELGLFVSNKNVDRLHGAQDSGGDQIGTETNNLSKALDSFDALTYQFYLVSWVQQAP